jgi:hypothetical protein
VTANRLIVQARKLPPASSDAAAGILRLSCEREYPSDLREIVFDYVGTPDASKPSTALLMGVSRSYLDGLMSAARIAGLRVVSVTAQAVAMTEATARTQRLPDGPVLCVTPGGSELVLQHEGSAQLVRHLPPPPTESSDSGADAWAGEVRRAMSMAGGLHTNGNSGALRVWDATGRRNDDWARLAQRLGMSVDTESELASLGVNGSPVSDAPQAVFAPAVAVARSVLVGAARPDFVHSRLAPPRRHVIGRRAAWTTTVAACVLAVAAWMWMDLQQNVNAAAELQARLDEIQEPVKSAKTLSENVVRARGWFDNRTPVLDCMLDLTLLIPEGRAWATNLTLNETGSGRLTGKAVEGFDIITILDHLKANKRFSNVTHTSTPRVVRGTRETTFVISFTYNRGG